MPSARSRSVVGHMHAPGARGAEDGDVLVRQVGGVNGVVVARQKSGVVEQPCRAAARRGTPLLGGLLRGGCAPEAVGAGPRMA